MSIFQHLNVHELTELLDKNPNIQLADIRDPDSFKSGHIEGATNLSNDNIAHFIAGADMDLPLVVICYHGISSQGAATYLVEQGFDDVYSLDGGYQAWREKS